MKHCDPDSAEKAKTVSELTKRNVDSVLKLEESTKSKTTLSDRVSDLITRFCGSMGFVYVHVVWYGLWIALNLTLPKRLQFDAYPFSLLTLVVSLEAIFLSAFVLISQNRQSVLSERRAQLDLQINVLSEQENTKMLCLLQAIAQKVDAVTDHDPEIELLAQAVKPEHLAAQIENAIDQNEAAENK